MRLSTFSALVLAALLLPSESTCPAADESELIAILRSNADPVAKAEACRQLRLVGTPKAVPALAAQLDDERVSHAARHALEALLYPETAAALRAAIDRTSGFSRLGVIDSLGWRRDADSVPHLAPLLLASDVSLATAAAIALGRIGDLAAIRSLQDSRDKVSAAVRPAVVDGLLAGADRRLSDGSAAAAAELFQSLTAPTEDDTVRTAAMAGWLRASGDQTLPRIIAALEGDDPVIQSAAVRVAADLRLPPAATATFTRLVSRPPASRQVAVLRLLQQRADPAVLPAVLAAAGNPDPAVRVAALGALGTVGDASSVGVLAKAAAKADSPEQAAARQSLLLVHRGDVTVALLASIPAATPNVRRELFRALANRSDRGAVPHLLALAQSDDDDVRDGALRTLGTLADGRHLGMLVQLISEARESSNRDDIRGVIESMIERDALTADTDLAPLLKGLADPSSAIRTALLPVAALIADPSLRRAIRSNLGDSDPQVRIAAGRALAQARDPGLMPDQLTLLRQSSDAGLRAIVLEGYVRLATDEGHSAPVPERVEALRQGLEEARRPEDRKLILSGLARLADRKALELAERAGSDPAVRSEADAACLQIARRLGPSDFEAVEAVLGRLSLEAADAEVRDEAQAILRQFDSHWLAAGPFRIDGKQASDLFHVPFPPERNGTDIDWRRAPGSPDPSRANEVDLGGITGGDHCVVYARTRVFSPSTRRVVFSLGSDDGLVLWLNGTLIHSNNAVRGLTPGQDRAKGELREGWNDLLAKITQHTAGCGLSLRLLADDGSEMSDLRFDPQGGRN